MITVIYIIGGLFLFFAIEIIRAIAHSNRPRPFRPLGPLRPFRSTVRPAHRGDTLALRYWLERSTFSHRQHYSPIIL